MRYDERHNSALELAARCARVGSAPGSLWGKGRRLAFGASVCQI